jgi:hypothetical protein
VLSIGDRDIRILVPDARPASTIWIEGHAAVLRLRIENSRFAPRNLARIVGEPVQCTLYLKLALCRSPRKPGEPPTHLVCRQSASGMIEKSAQAEMQALKANKAVIC